jgi:hypothetical protein
MEYFKSKTPIVTFNHRPSLAGKRKASELDQQVEVLPPWGNAKELWMRIHGSTV